MVVGNLGEEGDGEVAVTVEAEVGPMADEALRGDGGDGNDTPPFLKMIFIVACKGRCTTHGRRSLADY